MQKRNDTTKLSFGLAGIVAMMFGFGFALVPLYDVFCDITGLNGKIDNQAVVVAQELSVDKSRTVTVEFVTNIQQYGQWKFKPEVRKLKVHPGEMHTVSFEAVNLTGEDVVAQAIPSVAPGLAAQHLKKTECFCFNQQQFLAKEAKQMPVTFYVDSEIPEDVSILTLSYTLFKLNEDQITQNNRPSTVKKEI